MSRFTHPSLEQRDREHAQRAWDTFFRRPVALEFFPAGMSPLADGAALLAAWERWMTAPHPVFLRPALLDFKSGWLAREWVAGFSVLELLRQRRKLRADESLRLLQAAPAALDHAAAAGMLGELGLDRLFVQFRGNIPGEALEWSTRPLDVWPAWNLRIEPLRLSQHLPKDEWKTDRGIAPAQPSAAPAVELLRGFFRELAGAGTGREETPLATFNDAANSVLLSTRSVGAPTTARQFYDALAHACGAPTAPGAPAVPPTRAPEAGTLLLEPVKEHGRRLQIVARAELRLGRSSSYSDVVTRFPNDDIAEPGSRSQEISRLHARLRLHEGKIWLHDGKEGAPSRNGTFLRSQKIEAGAGLRLLGFSSIMLGHEWQASLLPAPSGVTVGTPDGTRWGALYVIPWEGCVAQTETVWLLEEAGFGVDAAGALVWDTEALGTAPGSFYLREGKFRIGNRRLNDLPLVVAGEPLAVGSSGELYDGDRLQVGASEWQVHLTEPSGE